MRAPFWAIFSLSNKSIAYPLWCENLACTGEERESGICELAVVHTWAIINHQIAGICGVAAFAGWSFKPRERFFFLCHHIHNYRMRNTEVFDKWAAKLCVHGSRQAWNHCHLMGFWNYHCRWWHAYCTLYQCSLHKEFELQPFRWFRGAFVDENEECS